MKQRWCFGIYMLKKSLEWLAALKAQKALRTQRGFLSFFYLSFYPCTGRCHFLQITLVLCYTGCTCSYSFWWHGRKRVKQNMWEAEEGHAQSKLDYQSFCQITSRKWTWLFKLGGWISIFLAFVRNLKEKLSLLKAFFYNHMKTE